jgi:hypothetical protein
MARSRAKGSREPGQVRKEAALSGLLLAPRASLAGATTRLTRLGARPQRWVHGPFSLRTLVESVSPGSTGPSSSPITTGAVGESGRQAGARRVGLLCACVLVLAGLGAASPPPAPAATTIGQLDPGTPSSACTGSSYWVQSVTSGPGYAIPAGGGVITSWSHKANVAPDRELGLRVFGSSSGCRGRRASRSGAG